MRIWGIGTIVNRGLLRTVSGVSGDGSINVGGRYVLNLGTIEAQTGGFSFEELRTAEENEEGGVFILGEEAGLFVQNAIISENSRIEGDGKVDFDGCTIDGTLAFVGELIVSNCVFSSSSEFQQKVSLFRAGTDVRVESAGLVEAESMIATNVVNPLALSTDLRVNTLGVEW